MRVRCTHVAMRTLLFMFFGTVATFIVVYCVVTIHLYYVSNELSRPCEFNKSFLHLDRFQGDEEWTPFNGRKTGIKRKRGAPSILLWHLPFGFYVAGLSKYVKHKPMSCPHHCFLTYDRTTLKQSDAVVFHGSDISPDEMPQWRDVSQKWVYWNFEPPPRIRPLVHMNGVFNWTMTYRSDSDIFEPYGRITQHKINPHYDFEKLKQTWRSKSTLAVWAVSHCNVDSRREEYVRELRKFATIDIYGKCGTKICPKDNRRGCYQMFSRKYFFHLSFENSICTEYVTEKLFNVLEYDIVPVVLGGANYTAVAPPGSFIDALSFKSPKHLAEYLKEVSRDFSLYRKYHRWKKKHTVVINSFAKGPFCDLCKMLHSSYFRQTTVTADIQQRWNATAECRSWNLNE